MLHCFIDCHTSYVTKRKTSSILGGAKSKRKCFDSILIAPQGASMLRCSANLRASNQTSHYICRTTTNPLYGVGDPLGIIWYLGKSVFINCQQYASD